MTNGKWLTTTKPAKAGIDSIVGGLKPARNTYLGLTTIFIDVYTLGAFIIQTENLIVNTPNTGP